MVRDSFISCVITTSTDGSDDNGLHCFKAGQLCAAGKNMLEEETKKLQVSGSVECLIQDPFASDDDSDESSNNEACIDDYDEEEEGDNDKEDDGEENDEEENDEEENDLNKTGTSAGKGR